MTNVEALTQGFARFYGPDNATLTTQKQRWSKLIDGYHQRFGETGVHLFSTPGRLEIGGNHTDHNFGKVLAASIDLDSIAAAAKSSDDCITVFSQEYDQPFVVMLDDLSSRSEEQGTTAALIRGVASRLRQLGYSIGGFAACIASDVPIGLGLSSSASIEVLIATIFNALFNDSKINAEKIALMAQYAENVYFGKPCGLMDQITCAVGGIVKIDFLDPQSPLVEKIDFDFTAAGFGLLVVNTGGSHADLTEDYALIPQEMKSVARQFGCEVCRQISEQELLNRLAELRSIVGDRAILRALHFLQENRRVDLQADALCHNDIQFFFRLIEESGNSSYRWLQNCIRSSSSTEQGIPLALALAEGFIRRCGGACRVHGGGFAGTILVFLPHAQVAEFRALMESVFGLGCVKTLKVRSRGSLKIQ